MPERGGGFLDRFHVGQPDPRPGRRGSARGQQRVKPLGIQRVDPDAQDDPGHDPRKVAPPHPIHRPSLAHSWPLHANLAPAVASTAWILAHAAHHTTVPADTATVIFGHHVRPITRPATAPAEVTEFTARDNWEDIPTAIDALDGALGLSHPGAARLLVIISDGHFRDIPRRDAQQRIDRLRATGCGVLWLTTDTTDTPLDGVTVHLITDPAATAQTIGHAATAALRATH